MKGRTSKGFTLVETMIAIAVIGFGLVAVGTVFPIILGTSEAARSLSTAVALARQLTDEIATRPFDDPDGAQEAPGFFDGKPRSAFDDIADYDGWSASPPQDEAGNVDNTYEDYARVVSVAYVSSIDFETVLGSGASDVQRITVTLRKDDQDLMSLVTLRFQGGNPEDN